MVDADLGEQIDRLIRLRDRLYQRQLNRAGRLVPPAPDGDANLVPLDRHHRACHPGAAAIRRDQPFADAVTSRPAGVLGLAPGQHDVGAVQRLRLPVDQVHRPGEFAPRFLQVLGLCAFPIVHLVPKAS